MKGPTLFARFAYPPNELGYCGPDDHAGMLEYASSGVVDGGLRQLAAGFEGAWPYLELIAGCNHVADPLDPRVVEAYWLGNSLVDGVTPDALWRHVEDRFRRRVGLGWSVVGEAMDLSARPTHAFHVFAMYPHVGLLRGGAADAALGVLDRCRIRWGQVVEVEGTSVVVRSRPLVFDGRSLALGAERVETARWGERGLGLVPAPAPGTWVAMHWDWVCATLDRRQCTRLRHHTLAELDRANRSAAGTAWTTDAAPAASGTPRTSGS